MTTAITLTVGITYGTSLFKDTSSSFEGDVATASLCNNVDFRVRDVTCTDSKLDTLVINNEASEEIGGFNLIVNDGTSSISTATTMDPGTLVSFGSVGVSPIAAIVEPIIKINVIPLISESQELKACSDKIQVVNIPEDHDCRNP